MQNVYVVIGGEGEVIAVLQDVAQLLDALNSHHDAVDGKYIDTLKWPGDKTAREFNVEYQIVDKETGGEIEDREVSVTMCGFWAEPLNIKFHHPEIEDDMAILSDQDTYEYTIKQVSNAPENFELQILTGHQDTFTYYYDKKEEAENDVHMVTDIFGLELTDRGRAFINSEIEESLSTVDIYELYNYNILLPNPEEPKFILIFEADDNNRSFEYDKGMDAWHDVELIQSKLHINLVLDTSLTFEDTSGDPSSR